MSTPDAGSKPEAELDSLGRRKGKRPTSLERLSGTVLVSEIKRRSRAFQREQEPLSSLDLDCSSDDQEAIESLPNREDIDEESVYEEEVSSSDDDDDEEEEEEATQQEQGRNLLIGSKELRHAITNEFMCPKCQKLSFEYEEDNYSGLAAGVYACCTTRDCGHTVSICHILGRRQNDSNGDAYVPKSRSQFPDYAVNHNVVLMMQHLGIGNRGLALILASLGLAPGYGNKDKWNKAKEELGFALEVVSKQVLEENTAAEITATKKDAEDKVDKWIEEERCTFGDLPTEADIDSKRKEVLEVENGKVGLAVGMDGAWQKRTVGVGQYNSRTGHNLAVGGRTGKIVNAIVYSKHCRRCEYYEKHKVPVPEHRCSRNYDDKMSAKAMEPLAAVQHCVEISKRTGDGVQAYVATLITDDDSTTRANCKHSYKQQMIQQYGSYNKAQRDAFGWPRKKGGKSFVDDHGKLPTNTPAVKTFLSDIGHRVKCFGKVMYQLKKKLGEKKKDINKHVTKYDCDRIKHLAGHFFKQKINQNLSFDEFCDRSHCIYLHHFDIHTNCDKEWCKRKQVESGIITERDLPDDYSIAGGHFRGTETDGQKQFFELIKKHLSPYVTTDMLRQVYHSFSTQKNESLNRKMVAVADKNRFLGGTMTLNDRCLLVVITDSVGYEEGWKCIHKKLGIPYHPVLQEYARRRDKEENNAKVRYKTPKVKKKRVKDRNKRLRDGLYADRKDRSDGVTYGTGIAIGLQQPTTPKRKKREDILLEPRVI